MDKMQVSLAPCVILAGLLSVCEHWWQVTHCWLTLLIQNYTVLLKLSRCCSEPYGCRPEPYNNCRIRRPRI